MLASWRVGQSVLAVPADESRAVAENSEENDMTASGKRLTMLSVLCCAALIVPLAGCTDARSEPLELTYYYLPG